LAHEVKNPLAGVRGAAQLLRRHVVDAELIALTDIILQEADRLASLADRLLRSANKPHLTSINLHEIAERIRALALAEVGPVLKIDRDYDPSLPGLHGDANRLQQLLLNLMRNAIEADAKQIVLRTRVEHNALIGERTLKLALRLELIDDGQGVPEELAQSLFLPLVSGRANGSGLGLALAQEIAREHGGTLSYRSRPGHTVFALLLPAGNPHG
jgi:two-component system nitrogen regulation sensor histidine kinase GlnL